MSPPLVSVSGVRGVLGESFTVELVQRWVAAFAQYIGERYGVADTSIVLGRDTRPSGAWALDVAIRTMVTLGIQPITVGVAPTPTVARAVQHHRAAGGLIITASHNPGEWNGLKFVGSDGVFLAARDMEQLRQMVSASSAVPLRSSGSVGLATQIRESEDESISPRAHDSSANAIADPDAIMRHVENVLMLPLATDQIRVRRFRVVVDPVNGTGALAVPPLLRKLGCTVLMMNGEPNGMFAHPPEPTSTNLGELGKRVREERAELGFAIDPDADRLVLVDETGTVISEEYTVSVAVRSVLDRDLNTDRRDERVVVVNLSTTRLVDDIAQEFGAHVVRTAVGERHVIDGMRRHHALIGGEGNGGVIFPRSHEGRDALVGIALVLDFLARKNTSLACWTRGLPQYFMAKEKIPRSAALVPDTLAETLCQAFPGAQISTLDGVRVDTADGWVHVRPSNTEPVTRLIGEARTKEALSALLAVTSGALRAT